MNQIDKITQIINEKLTELDKNKNAKGVIKRYLAEQKYIQIRDQIGICNSVLYYYKKFKNENIAKNCVSISQYGSYVDPEEITIELIIREFVDTKCIFESFTWNEYNIKIKQKYIRIGEYSPTSMPEFFFKDNILDILEKELGEIDTELNDEEINAKIS